ncbi:hypothetical protein AB0N38_28130 [Micromonospora aurantiaca]|uniref:hypothetical protein n=1 Tax=Micromonospora aurantiaca (nom. illeg.) TaxID=47850 RepID=UPI000827F821|nr:hypothetical protein [Micromonospora aurantiaca]SCL37834.1 hypothetical protein GA0070615_3504 [Micromonospora aurantiaca]
MAFISFSVDEYRLPLFNVTDQRYRALGAWLITDVSVSYSACLDALQMIDDVANGRPLDEGWDSDKYEVSFAPTGVEFVNEWVADERGRYSLDETREAVESYWRFLAGRPENRELIREYRPDLPRWEAELLQWEERWGRPHPYRGRLF